VIGYTLNDYLIINSIDSTNVIFVKKKTLGNKS